MSKSSRRRSRPVLPIALVLVASLAAAALQWGPYSNAGSASAGKPVTVRQCTVHSVHDGDSMRAHCPGFRKTLRIRLDQIDAPEINQAWGTRSRDYLRSLCPLRSPVKIHDLGPDRYGRTLARVFCQGKDVNAAMVAAGAAWVYDHYADDEALYRLQADARKARRGLWAASKVVRPWEFRRNNR
ncbi:MAG: thermonuclease family protein [Castellaniella sp.]